VNDCLNTDLTELQTTNLKAEVQLFKGNKLSLYNLFSKKVRNARNASDLTPIESTVRQAAVSSSYGQWGWRTGPSPTYKFGDQWVVSDRLLLDVQYGHVGNNFILDYHEDALADVQPTFIVSTSLNGRSTPDGQQSVNIRPVNSVNVNMNYFMPGAMGGDHAVKMGGYWKDANSYNSTHTPGYAVARFPTAVSNDCSLAATACQAQVTRDGQTEFDLLNVSAYVQDTYTHNGFTAQIGVRYDYNHDQALSSAVGANPLVPQLLPAVTFPGADPGVAFHNVSPRLGLTYDLSGIGKTLIKANYAILLRPGRDIGRVGPGQPGLACERALPVGRSQRRQVRSGERADAGQRRQKSAGGDRQLGSEQSRGGHHRQHRRPELQERPDRRAHRRHRSRDRRGVRRRRELHLAALLELHVLRRRRSRAVGLRRGVVHAAVERLSAAQSARCPTVTYYQPLFQLPTITNETNFTTDQFNRSYNGVELSVRPADVASLAAEFQLRVQQRRGPQRLRGGGCEYRERGSDQPGGASRIPVRSADRGQRPRQCLRQCEVAVQIERRLRGAVRRQRLGVL
jgi:hypothetical protein